MTYYAGLLWSGRRTLPSLHFDPLLVGHRPHCLFKSGSPCINEEELIIWTIDHCVYEPIRGQHVLCQLQESVGFQSRTMVGRECNRRPRGQSTILAEHAVMNGSKVAICWIFTMLKMMKWLIFCWYSLGWMELQTIMAKVSFRYDLELVNKELDWNRDSWMHTLWEKPSLLARVLPRQEW